MNLASESDGGGQSPALVLLASVTWASVSIHEMRVSEDPVGGIS